MGLFAKFKEELKKTKNNIVGQIDSMIKSFTKIDEELFEELGEEKEEAFVIGGQSIYEQLLPYCDVVHVTRIDQAYEADTEIRSVFANGEAMLTGKIKVGKKEIRMKKEDFQKIMQVHDRIRDHAVFSRKILESFGSFLPQVS